MQYVNVQQQPKGEHDPAKFIVWFNLFWANTYPPLKFMDNWWRCMVMA